MYSQHITQLWKREKITAWSEKDALAAVMSFMPNQASRVEMIRNGTHTNPAFCSHSVVPSSVIWPPPTKTAKAPVVITIGTRNCITDTPRLPRPAFIARAWPFSFFG